MCSFFNSSWKSQQTHTYAHPLEISNKALFPRTECARRGIRACPRACPLCTDQDRMCTRWKLGTGHFVLGNRTERESKGRNRIGQNKSPDIHEQVSRCGPHTVAPSSCAALKLCVASVHSFVRLHASAELRRTACWWS
jgi:hypothetical protein